MERERRYCMRFLRPCFSLDSIRVEINIQDVANAYNSDKLQYILEENGYPSDPISGGIKNFVEDIRTGEEEIEFLKKWGKL